MSPIPRGSRLPAQKGGWTGKRKNSEREYYWEHLFASWRISAPTRGVEEWRHHVQDAFMRTAAPAAVQEHMYIGRQTPWFLWHL